MSTSPGAVDARSGTGSVQRVRLVAQLGDALRLGRVLLFVVQIHPEGISTLENLSTQERVRLEELAAVGSQIERWLAEEPGDAMPAAPRSEPNRSGSAPG